MTGQRFLLVLILFYTGCGSSELGRLEAARGVVEVFCQNPSYRTATEKENGACVPDSLPQDSLEMFGDSLEIRFEGEDLRHVDIGDMHVASFYRTESGWAARASEEWKNDLREYESMLEKAEDRVREALLNISLGQDLYEMDHGEYSTAIHRLETPLTDRIVPIGVEAEIVGAGENWWLAKASNGPVECVLLEGPVPEEHDQLVKEFDADDVLAGCLPD